mmetsp:Transcript_12484/g.24883  ORF Transcript_12484/g.24883 Transcript_12484/m.24883 type:complete len:154 (+) Transcript_12484:168-629(+)
MNNFQPLMRLNYHRFKLHHEHTTRVAFLLRSSLTNRLSSNHVPAYVHPLSQIILEHLQKSKAGWIEKHGVDRGLRIEKDGSFQISFPENQGKIWTWYDPVEKKHWLEVAINGVVGKYILQDNLKPAWQDSASSAPERIQKKVDEMINRLEELG